MQAPAHNDLAKRLAVYLSTRLANGGSVRIEGLSRIVGGASRETWSFDAVVQGASSAVHGEPRTAGPGRASHTLEVRHGFILRRDPDAGLLESDRGLEYRVLHAFDGSDVPVPRVFWLETGDGPLERPFFIMERIDGCRTDGAFLASRPDDERRRRIAERKFQILGAIHAADPVALGLHDLDPLGLPQPHEAAERQLRHWERILEQQASEPLPIVRLAIAWLREHMPPAAQRIVLCHGDFRSGNFLYDYEAGTIRGVLDWEMAHLGDPLEDLAWTCLVNWRYGGGGPVAGWGDLIGGIAERSTAFATYEKCSGIRVDAAALHWWDVFSQVKAVGIWITGGRSFADGRTNQPFMAMIPRLLNGSQYQALLDLLAW